MKNSNNAARTLFIGAKIFNLESAQVDSSHKSKGKELRIEVAATIYTTKLTLVNELKGINLPGGKQGIVVNGGPEAIKIPANYEFVDNAKDFDVDDITADKKYFADYETAKNIANMANEGELIRLQAIEADLKGQISLVKSVMKANEDASALHVINED